MKTTLTRKQRLTRLALASGTGLAAVVGLLVLVTPDASTSAPQKVTVSMCGGSVAPVGAQSPYITQE